MAKTGNKRMDAIKKALAGKRKKNKCKRCGGIGHFVPDCPTLTEGEKKWYGEERQRNKEKRKEKWKKYVGFEEEFDIMSARCGLTVGQAMKFIPSYRKNVKNIDIDNEEMRIKGKYGTRVIPIEFTREIDDKEEEYESEEDMREAYC